MPMTVEKLAALLDACPAIDFEGSEERRDRAVAWLLPRLAESAGICAHRFDNTVCVAPVGHDGPHMTSNAEFPRGLVISRLAESEACPNCGRVNGAVCVKCDAPLTERVLPREPSEAARQAAQSVVCDYDIHPLTLSLALHAAYAVERAGEDGGMFCPHGIATTCDECFRDRREQMRVGAAPLGETKHEP